jgi:hypothetical protein
MRADRLPIVVHVEGIVTMARSEGVAFAVVAGAALVGLVSPLVAATVRSIRQPVDASAPHCAALLAYLSASVVASFLGPYPVPALGAGAGPVLGAMACIALAHAMSPPAELRPAKRRP